MDREEEMQISITKPVAGILENEYWSRIWIVHEFAFARKIQILTETRVIDEKALHRLINDSSDKVKRHS